ncbi:MAG: hypothetical protein MRY76_01485 [Pseudomonadales bacterium]|nr:hypothetical protein [Pseudomonadales bacterium]
MKQRRPPFPIARLSVLIPLIGLIGCASTDPASNEESAADTAAPAVRVLSEARVYTGDKSAEQARLVADLLFEGLQALDADRLLTPIDDNAHARFQRVLAYEPDNALALEGLESIVLRYVELAEDASRQGLFEQAETLLDRARFVDESHTAIVRAEAMLAAEKQSGDLFFDLDAPQVRSRSDSVQEKLADIARQAREHEAFFLITAPNDEQARWIFSVMRDAVDGYRLRGNIELASRYSIRLRMPEQESRGD